MSTCGLRKTTNIVGAPLMARKVPLKQKVSVASEAQMEQFMSPIRPINMKTFQGTRVQYTELAAEWAEGFLDEKREDSSGLQPTDILTPLCKLKTKIVVEDTRPLVSYEFYFADKVLLPMAIAKLNEQKQKNGTVPPVSNNFLLRLVAMLYTLNINVKAYSMTGFQKENDGQDLRVQITLNGQNYEYEIENYLDLERSKITVKDVPTC